MSSTALRLESSQWEQGLVSGADPFAGDTFTDIVSMKRHNRVTFVAHWGTGATGVVKFTVEACDDVSASNTAKIPFYYRINNNGTHGALTLAVAADGVSNTAGSNQIIVIETTAEHLAASGYNYVRLSCDETTDSPLAGGVLIQLSEPRNTAATPTTALA
jgi:hypothetical protein